MTGYSLTNFPNGFPGGLTIFGVPEQMPGTQLPSSGRYLFVKSSTGADGNPGTIELPLATLQRAITLSTADTNQIIVLLPGHAETIVAAGGITVNKSGLQIIGLGAGADRPTFTFGTSAAATFLITSGNLVISNIVGTTTVDQVVSPFVVQAANVSMNIEWQDGSSVLEALRAVLTSAAASNFWLRLKYNGFTAGTHTVNAVRLVGTAGARINIDFYGVLTTAAVEFSTTLSSNVQVSGSYYISGISNQSRMVVDTITGSLWSVLGWDAVADMGFSGGTNLTVAPDDTSAIAAALLVPTANATTNVNMRDVVGNKTDTLIDVVGTTKSLMAYLKGTLANLSGAAGIATFPASAAPANAVSIAGALRSLWDGAIGSAGIAAYPTAAAPANAVSVAAVVSELYSQEERTLVRAAAVLVNGQTIFTITGGPIQIVSLYAYCLTVCDATASTLQYNSTPTIGSAATFSGATASLANMTAGSSIVLAPTALSTAPTIVTGANGGVQLGLNVGNLVIINAGIVTTVIGVGSTTGTFTIHLRYRPLARGITVA